METLPYGVLRHVLQFCDVHTLTAVQQTGIRPSQELGSIRYHIQYPCQSGKTGRAIQYMKHVRGTWIVIHGNNKALGIQWKQRLTQYGVQSSIWSSSTSLTINDLEESIIGSPMSMVVWMMCANYKRVQQLIPLLTKLSRPVHILFDESDTFVPQVKQVFEAMYNRPNVWMYSMTSTPTPLLVELFPVPMPEMSVSNRFASYQESYEIRYDVDEDDAFKGDLLNLCAGRWFLPTPRFNKLIHVWHGMGYTVVSIGMDKRVYYTDQSGVRQVWDIRKELASRELKDIISSFWTSHRYLNAVPFIVTGYACINRGITIQSDAFRFDYAVMRIYRDRSKQFKRTSIQALGRLCGYFKDVHHKTIVYGRSHW